MKPQRRKLHWPAVAAGGICIGIALLALVALISRKPDAAGLAEELHVGMSQQEVERIGGRPDNELSGQALRKVTGGITPKGTTGWVYEAPNTSLVLSFRDGRLDEWIQVGKSP